ncbi:uncharacterized protein DUF2569 [Enterobacter sp. BIGb0383]|uniref:DUF2569 domain-containing protein n=1 Tax=unclassified Enterobacter TaxID=2608935 RepID=UPI000F918A6E|nr:MULTISPECIES: DUF2569 domain-containing protein [unclassified Enterobacter]ROP60058.1 uncharacterized protein DUF2569 [Enterobacter sp. BIGb0383]ROS08475.1 uncharacterized protein DUF2569 [Enterobacter sp. BIGb0359]
MDNREHTPGQEIGGWLWLAVLWLFIGVMSYLISAIDLQGMLRGSYGNLADPQVRMLLFYLGSRVGLLGYSVWVAFLFYQRKRVLPFAVITLIIAELILSGIDLLLLDSLLFFPLDIESALSVFRALIVAAIAIPYFCFSQRVKRTFVK